MEVIFNLVGLLSILLIGLLVIGYFATLAFYSIKAFLGGRKEIKKIINFWKTAWVPLLIPLILLLVSLISSL